MSRVVGIDLGTTNSCVAVMDGDVRHVARVIETRMARLALEERFEEAARVLRPGGRLFIREGHPVLWALDYERTDGELVLAYPYRETAAPLIDSTEGSYVEIEGALINVENHSWNHGLGEIVSAVLDAGLVITQFVEHESVPWNPLPDGMMRLDDSGEWRLVDRPERLPLTYTLQARKPDATDR